MEKNNTVGLTLGKYAPFHKGHQFVIDTALKEVGELIILIYDCPETTDVPLKIRADWVRKLYPQAHVVEAWEGPREEGSTEKVRSMHREYILNLLGKRKITHFYCSEFYGNYISKALGAIDKRVDEKRGQVPISATKIRENVYENKRFLDPIVYRDNITNVVFLGAPSSGKTTLAKQLAGQFNTIWMPEYGREYWNLNQINKRLSLKQLTEIAKGHLERENKFLLDANKYLFTDTNALTTRLFSLYYHEKVDKELEQIADKCVSRYDIVFVCDIDIPYDNTWDRSGEVNRKIFQDRILDDLRSRKIPFIILSGTLEERINKVKQVLLNHKKYSNLSGFEGIKNVQKNFNCL